MALTPETLRTDIEYRLKSISDVADGPFLKWCDYWNKLFYRELSQVDAERFMSEEDYTVTTNPQTEALPDDFRDIQANGAGFFKMDDDFVEYQLVRTGFGSRKAGFWITGDDVIFTGYESSTAVKLRYIPAIATITTTTADLCVPDEYEQLFEEALIGTYAIWSENEGMEVLSDQRFMNYRDDFLGSIRKEPEVYTLTSIHSAYR